MQIPTVILTSESIKRDLTELINEYIRIEKSENSVHHLQKTTSIRGQIALITSFFDQKWNCIESDQNYFNFLEYIVNKYELSGVWRDDELLQN